MTYPKIVTPRGSIVVVKGANGVMKAELKWNTSFVPKWQGRFSEAQKFVDREVLRLTEPFIPLRTGMLIKSGILGTVIGQGFVKWIAPYARYQYYLVRKTKSETGKLRGSLWFHRMKALYWKYIRGKAAEILKAEKAT